MNRVIVVGSPRVNGRSALLADQLLYACIEECPDDVVSIVSVASITVAPCVGCDACAAETAASPDVEEGDPLSPHPLVAQSSAARHQCVIDDDMAEVRKHLDGADELIVVSPVYFAGPPAQFKALLDRLQPYFRSDVRTREKRPLILHVVGEGGDPHGWDPLAGCVQSAFSVAGFKLVSIFDWVGKIDEDGTFLGEPEEYALEPLLEAAGPSANEAPAASTSDGLSIAPQDKPKPILSLSNPKKTNKSAAKNRKQPTQRTSSKTAESKAPRQARSSRPKGGAPRSAQKKHGGGRRG